MIQEVVINQSRMHFLTMVLYNRPSSLQGALDGGQYLYIILGMLRYIRLHYLAILAAVQPWQAPLSNFVFTMSWIGLKARVHSGPKR